MAIRGWILGVAALAVAAPLTAQAETESITCKDKAGEVAYKLDVDWSSEKAVIHGQEKGAWKKLFEAATVVRNGAGDAAMLAEGAAKDYVGGFKAGGCGGVIESPFFDLTSAGDGKKRKGTVAIDLVWAAPLNATCRPNHRSPEPLTQIHEVTCE